ncbi:MAG TPA: glycosyltransferase family 1 protein [Candidatus Dormibacteraeota bacterium]|nr:glycosyltransferase family 1 protein [Candidatus Dormibacteraeota bacterium]
MRIAVDAHMVGERETGNETYILNLLRGLASLPSEDRYQVLTPRPDELRAMLTLPERFELVRIWPSQALLRIPIAMPRAVRRHRSDILHVTYVAPPAARCATVVTVHDLSFAVYPQAVPWRTRLILTPLVPPSVRRASRVIAISEHTRADLIRRYRLAPEKVAVIHLAPSSAFRPLPDARHQALPGGVSDPFILAVGSLEPRKNLLRLIDAFASLVSDVQFPGKLVLVARQQPAAHPLVRALRRHGLEDRVVFTGYLSEAALNLLYNRAALFVYPSLYEGFGLPPVEAMASGCPVVASSASALPETLGNAAVLVDPTSTSALAGAMRSVLERDDLRRELREKGLRRAASYSWEKVARQTHAVYAEALNASLSPVTS